MARPGIEPRTSGLRVRCPTDCAARPGRITIKLLVEKYFFSKIIETRQVERRDFCILYNKPGHVAQSVGHLTQGSWVRFTVRLHTFVSPSADSRRAVVSYWRKYVHEVLLSCLGGLSLTRKSVVRLTNRPDMTLDVYHGC